MRSILPSSVSWPLFVIRYGLTFGCLAKQSTEITAAWPVPACSTRLRPTSATRASTPAVNDRNYFEIAHSLNRLFGEGGLYRELTTYNFVDNHDVNRIASMLRSAAHLYPLYLLLFTIPGVPSIYAGSEWGLEGVKSQRRRSAATAPATLAGRRGGAWQPA